MNVLPPIHTKLDITHEKMKWFIADYCQTFYWDIGFILRVQGSNLNASQFACNILKVLVSAYCLLSSWPIESLLVSNLAAKDIINVKKMVLFFNILMTFQTPKINNFHLHWQAVKNSKDLNLILTQRQAYLFLKSNF